MSSYYFILGSTPLLSAAELTSVFPDCHFDSIAEHVLVLPEDCQPGLDPKKTLEKLGGTVKIARAITTIGLDQQENLEAIIAEQLSTSDPTEKIVFAIAQQGKNNLPGIDLSSIKKQLVAQGFKARFIESPQTGLSAAVLTHHSVREIQIIYGINEIHLAETVATQDIDAWSKRDRQKPYANRKKGMLPPKVARIMVNLALRSVAQTTRLYDPFCGTGTVLMEGALLGCEVVGSDLDQESVDGSRLNMQWLEKETDQKFSYHVFHKDVTQVSPSDVQQNVDVIVTEPFLGKPTPQFSQLPNIFKGLEKLYSGAFKRWREILNNEGRVVIVFPLVITPQRRFDLGGLIDKLREWGYTLEIEPVVYHRPNAVVQRQILVFRYHRSK